MVALSADIAGVPAWELLGLRMGVTAVVTYVVMRVRGVEHPLLGPPCLRSLLLARGCLGFGFLGRVPTTVIPR